MIFAIYARCEALYGSPPENKVIALCGSVPGYFARKFSSRWRLLSQKFR
jgi:hypothetical protein